MKRKIISVLLTLVLVCSFSLVTAVPVAAEPGEAEGELVGSYSYSWTTSIMNSTDFDFTVGMGWSGPFPWPPNVYFFFHPDEIPLGGYTEPIGGSWLFENIDFDGTAEGQTFLVTSVADDPDFAGFASLLTNGTDEAIWLGFMGDRDNIASAGGQKSVQESQVFPGTDVPGWRIESISLTFNQIYLDPENVNKLVLDFTLGIYAFPPTEVWVVPTGDDSNPGTEASPFATIQKGIDTVAGSGTVNVLAGTYDEMVTITKSVTLRGANWGVHPAVGTHPTETVGTRGSESVIVHAWYAFLLQADAITIDGFKFTGEVGGVGQIIRSYADANNFHLTNCIFDVARQAPSSGWVLFGDASHNDVLIDFNLFEDVQGDATLYFGGLSPSYDRLRVAYNRFNCGKDSIFWATDTPMVDGIIEGNEFDGTIDGAPGTGLGTINIGKGGNIIIRNDWFHDQQYNPLQVGIIGGSVTNNIFERIYPLAGGPGDALQLWGGEWGTAVSTDVVIADNTIRYNDIAGASYPSHGIRLRPPEGGPGIDGSTIHIHLNNFEDGGARSDAYAIRHQGELGTVVDAEYNWWGDASGPYHLTNPDGLGGAVSDDVDYMPWYATETTTPERQYVTVKVGETEEVRAYSDTIQPAIDAALAGDTINVAAGEYDENVVIQKSINLFGEDKDNTTLTYTSTPTVEQLIMLGWNTGGTLPGGATIQGFTLLADVGLDGDKDLIKLRANGAPDSPIVIKDNIFQGDGATRYLGIETAYDAGYVNVENNEFYDLAYGAWFNVLTDATIKGNIIDSSRFSGLAICTGDPDVTHDIAITGNTITNSGTAGDLDVWNSGLHLGSTIYNLNVQGNTIQDGNRYSVVIHDRDTTDLTNVHINANNIYNNPNGLLNEVTSVDATYNWWGNPNGPSAAAFSTYPVGDAVSGDVDYSPWLPGEWEDYFDPVAEDFIDTDGDGFSDLDEYWLGTDHEDSRSFPGAAIDPGQVDNAYVEGDDPDEVNLQDSEGETIADVDISGGGDASGTITGARYTEEPEEETGLSVGTGTTGVVFLDVKVTGYTEGIAHITVPYPDVDPDDGIVDDTDPPVDETTLSLYYWDEDADMWLIADNNEVDTDGNNVSGDIPISALTGTPVGMGGYLEDEATVAIESILNLSNKGDGSVKLTINTNTAFLGAATIDLIFDPRVVEVLGVVEDSSAFDTLTVNPDYAVIGNDTQIARFVARQAGATGVNATEGAVVAVVKLKAVGSTMDVSPLHLEVTTLKDNKGDIIPLADVATSFAIVGGVGDANRDTYVDLADVVEIERAIAGFLGYSIDTPTMDVDGKDDVDAFDCTYLARHLIDLPEYPLPPLGWMPPWGP